MDISVSGHFLENFNPRTREGCDVGVFRYLSIICGISIHAPVKGATRIHMQQVYRIMDFNPRTREGCDNIEDGRLYLCLLYFNPRTREGCDCCISCFSHCFIEFQSTHP